MAAFWDPLSVVEDGEGTGSTTDDSESLLDDVELVPEAPTKAPALLDGKRLAERLQWYPPPTRPHSRRELLADHLVNFLGVVLALLGTPILGYMSWLAGDRALKQLGFWVFGAGTVTMLTCSALFHHWSWHWRSAKTLLGLDHVGINAMIMGCYTPVMIEVEGFGVLALVWSLGAYGIVVEGFGIEKLSGGGSGPVTCCAILHIVRYLVMGWSILLIFTRVMSDTPQAAWVGLIVGGTFYSVGVVFHLWKALEFHQSIWHAFVLIASICLYTVNMCALVGHE